MVIDFYDFPVQVGEPDFFQVGRIHKGVRKPEQHVVSRLFVVPESVQFRIQKVVPQSRDLVHHFAPQDSQPLAQGSSFVECVVLVYKCGQEKLNNLYYQMKEQRR